MRGKVFQFLDEVGSKEFIKVLNGITQSNINNSIGIDTNSDTSMPSAKTVLSLINGILSVVERVGSDVDEARRYLNQVLGIVGIGTPNGLVNLRFEFIIGDINQVVNPNKDILYFQHDDPNDTSWVMYVYSDGTWRSVGNIEYDLVNYWSKSDNGLIEALHERAIENLSEINMSNRVNQIFSTIEEK